MKDESPELLPCPFCGGDGQEKWAHNGRAFCWIECADCGAKGAWARVGHDGSGTRNWNTRALSPAPQITDEMVERAALAIFKAWWGDTKGWASTWHLARPTHMAQARAALTAALATQEAPQ